jgi:hypothetical protein
MTDPAPIMPAEAEEDVEIYTPERLAEFFLNNAIDAESYAYAREEVRKLGLDPDEIDHIPPPDCRQGLPRQ